MPPPENHKWPKADVYLGDGWSLAYRVIDAQYWGVPQRRARIYLVADFDGESAGEILFKSEGLSGYFAEGFRSWQRTAGGAEEGTGETNRVIGLEHHPTDSRIKIDKSGTIQTLTERMGTGGNNVPLVAEPVISLEGNGMRPSHLGKGYSEEQASFTLNTVEKHAVAYGVGAYNSKGMMSDNPAAGFYKAKTSRTLDQSGGNPCCNQGGGCVLYSHQPKQTTMPELQKRQRGH